MRIIESFTGFQPLEETWIGGTYPISFYDHLPNEIQDTFGKITEQTEIGFTNLQKTLEKQVFWQLDSLIRIRIREITKFITTSF